MLSTYEQTILSFLQEKIEELQWIGLFGSVLHKGFDMNRSDINIAFISQIELSNVVQWELQEELASLLNRDIDLLDLRKSDDVISFEVLSKGKEIYKTGSKELELLLDSIYVNYIHLNEDRREIMEMYA